MSMSTKMSSPTAARAPRTKDKLKHSRNETRRRARIRDQFEGLKNAIQCEKKDRYNILQYATEVVRTYQSRVALLDSVIAKYESITKQRINVPPLVMPSIPPTTKRQSSASYSATRKYDSEEAEEEMGDEEEEEDELVDEEEGGGGLDELDESHDVMKTHSIGSTTSSSQPIPSPTVAVTTGTAVNVLAALASAASASATSSTTVPIKAKRISPKPLVQHHSQHQVPILNPISQGPQGAIMATVASSMSDNASHGSNSSASKKRKLDTEEESKTNAIPSPSHLKSESINIIPYPSNQQPATTSTTTSTTTLTLPLISPAYPHPHLAGQYLTMMPSQPYPIYAPHMQSHPTSTPAQQNGFMPKAIAPTPTYPPSYYPQHPHAAYYPHPYPHPMQIVHEYPSAQQGTPNQQGVPSQPSNAPAGQPFFYANPGFAPLAASS